MGRHDSIARAVRLKEWLEESRAGITFRAAAEAFQVSERTVRRDVDALRALDYPVQQDYGRISLPKGVAVDQRLGETERRKLVMSAIASGPLQGTPLVPDARELSERLFATAKQRELFAKLQVPLAAPHHLSIDYRKNHYTHMQLFYKAIEERSVVAAVYYTAGRDQVTKRDIDPHAFYYDHSLETLYLFAYCHFRSAFRTFAIHRFRQAHITRRVFKPDPAFSVKRHLAGAFRMYRGQQTAEVALRFAPKIAKRIVERKWHASQKTTELPDGSVDLSFTVDGDEEIRPFILSHGAQVRVMQPSWLAERVAEEASKVTAIYEGQGKKTKGAARGEG